MTTDKPAKVRTGRDWGEAVVAVLLLIFLGYVVLFQPEILSGWHGFVAVVMFVLAGGALVKFLRRQAPEREPEQK